RSCAHACRRPRRSGARSPRAPVRAVPACVRRGPQPSGSLPRARPSGPSSPLLAKRKHGLCPPGIVESRQPLPPRDRTTMAAAETSIETGDKGLKRDAIGFASNLVIGVASTAPAYSLAATLGFVVAVNGVGVHAPAVLLISFLPIVLIALAYKYLNRADPDAGPTLASGARALGPWVGWFNGWAIFVADVIVMASLAVIASTYTYLLFGWNSAATSTTAILIGSTLWIALMTWICWRGIELSARIQQFLLAA